MIEILGFRRVIVLVILLAVNALLAAASYLYLVPEKTKLERDSMATKSALMSVRSDIDNMERELALLEEQRVEFQALENTGFFETQDRYMAEQIFTQTQGESNVLGASASITAGEMQKNKIAAEASHDILKSKISVKIESLDDLSVFKYAYLLEKKFPGFLSIDKMTINRQGEISGIVLRGLANGEEPNLVSATIEASWNTMIPSEENNNSAAEWQ